MDRKYFILILAIACSIIILFNPYLLRLGIAYDVSLAFWIPVLILGFLMFYTTFTMPSKFPLILIMIFAFTFHMIQFVRQPSNVIWNDDSVYVFQIVENILKTGRFTFGFGTGMAPTYTFYPLFYVFLSVLSSVTSLSSMIIVKYSMAILNLATLLGFYAMLSILKLGVKPKNLIVCMFALNPMFHFFNSYAHAESFAIIMYPLIIMYTIGREKPRPRLIDTAIAIVLLIIVTMSHHFTSYVTALTLVVPSILLYIIHRKTLVRIELRILALILPLTWLTFVAYSLFTTQLVEFKGILQSLTSIHTIVGYTSSSFQSSFSHYPSTFSIQITWLRNITLVLITLIGFFYYIRHKELVYSYFKSLLVISSAITFVMMFIVDWSQVGATPRTRFLEFAFFPIAIFAGLGLMKLYRKVNEVIQKRGSWLRENHSLQSKLTTLMFVSLLVGIFVPPMIFNAFDRFNYDPTYSPFLSDEVDVAPETQYALGRWVLISTNASEKNVFAGSISAHKYVIGYGQQEKWANEIFTVTSIEEEMQQTWFEYVLYYVVSKWNIRLPDTQGRIIDGNITDFLDGNFNRIYDNEFITSYRQPTFTKEY